MQNNVVTIVCTNEQKNNNLKQMFYKVGTWLCRLRTQTFWSRQFSFELLPDFLCELKIKQFVTATLFIATNYLGEIHKNDAKIGFFFCKIILTKWLNCNFDYVSFDVLTPCCFICSYKNSNLKTKQMRKQSWLLLIFVWMKIESTGEVNL